MATQVHLVSDDSIISRIHIIRDIKVMIDKDLAILYNIETRVLKQAVRRNIDRFPEDFMFELTKEENESLKSASETRTRGRHSKYLPFAFSEHGVLMLSSVLNSDRAIKVNIQIMRIYTKMKEMLLTHHELLIKMNELESKILNHDKSIRQVFDYLRQFVNDRTDPPKRIGFKQTSQKI